MLVAFIIMKITHDLIHHSFRFVFLNNTPIPACRDFIKKSPWSLLFVPMGLHYSIKSTLQRWALAVLGYLMMTSSNGNIFRVTGPCEGNSHFTPHIGQWGGALMLSLICAWTYGWAKNRDAGDSRHHGALYDVTAMFTSNTHRLT